MIDSNFDFRKEKENREAKNFMTEINQEQEKA